MRVIYWIVRLFYMPNVWCCHPYCWRAATHQLDFPPFGYEDNTQMCKRHCLKNRVPGFWVTDLKNGQQRGPYYIW